MTVISCINLNKSYISGIHERKKHQALVGMSLNIQKGETFGIIGANGAGKSTLMKIIMGFIRQDSGEILINGSPPTSSSSRSHIGYLPENPCLYGQLSLADHLMFSARVARKTKQWTNDKIRQIAEKVDLLDHLNSPIQNFSKGMTQRSALAFSLFLDPEILILDEPMSGLDPIGRQLVLDIINSYKNKGTTILFCSHILNDIERICTRIGIMHKGVLKAVTTPEMVQKKTKEAFPREGKTPLESFFLHTITQE